MICISINQESRRFALVDMLNAAKQCDLLEIRLDRFDKDPNVGELLAAKPKPVIMSCRRPRDGGSWAGTEEERLTLLRQCIIGKADYVEIELDVADQIRKFPPAKRVIAYTNLHETPADIVEIYAQAQTKNPDVIKLTTVANTPEEAWPLVQILAKPPVPTVVVGLGKPGVMLTVLGKKIGAPWAYAALERGMEAYPGQPTVHDLETVYHFRAIERSTRLIGVSGFEERDQAIVAGLNAAFAHLNLPTRCWPLAIGNLRLFRKVLDAVKLAGVVVDEPHQRAILDIATEQEPAAQQAMAADLILHKNDKWHGYYTRGKAAITALEAALKAKNKSLQGRIVVVVGLNPTARMLAPHLVQQGASLIVASHDKKGAQQFAQELACRHVQFEALYSTIHDVLIVCDEEKEQFKGRSGEAGIHPGYLKAGMTVLDLTADGTSSALLREARARGCQTVGPRELLLGQLALQARLITGKEIDIAVFAARLPVVDAEEEAPV